MSRHRPPVLPRRPRAGLARPPRWLQALWLVLALALLQAQWLGHRHRVLHAPIGLPASMATAGSAATGNGIDALFGHVAGDTLECRLFDQIGHAGALIFVPAALAFAAAEHTAIAFARLATGAAPRGLAQARAPPRR